MCVYNSIDQGEDSNVVHLSWYRCTGLSNYESKRNPSLAAAAAAAAVPSTVALASIAAVVA